MFPKQPFDKRYFYHKNSLDDYTTNDLPAIPVDTEDLLECYVLEHEKRSTSKKIQH